MRKIRVSNTNGNRYQRDVVRVYLNDVKIAEVFVPSRNPLRYICRHPGSKYRKALAAQVEPYGLTLLDVFSSA